MGNLLLSLCYQCRQGVVSCYKAPVHLTPGRQLLFCSERALLPPPAGEGNKGPSLSASLMRNQLETGLLKETQVPEFSGVLFFKGALSQSHMPNKKGAEYHQNVYVARKRNAVFGPSSPLPFHWPLDILGQTWWANKLVGHWTSENLCACHWGVHESVPQDWAQ